MSTAKTSDHHPTLTSAQRLLLVQGGLKLLDRALRPRYQKDVSKRRLMTDAIHRQSSYHYPPSAPKFSDHWPCERMRSCADSPHAHISSFLDVRQILIVWFEIERTV